MRISILFVALIFTFSVDHLSAQIDSKVNLDFVNKIPQWLDEHKVPALGVGIIENGQLKYSKVFGELQKGVPAPDQAIFEIASMIKPVVAIVTLKIVEAGQWNLDEQIANYWVDSDLLNDTFLTKLTTRQILSHQSGFPNWRNEKLLFEFEPGTKYQYSGEGFEYLRNALESKFQRTLVELSDSILFKPLGMKNTWYYFANEMDTKLYAIPHDGQGNKITMSRDRNINAAALLLTTIEDYAKFMIHVMNGAGLSPCLFNDMVCPQVHVKEHISQGLGWGLVYDLPKDEFAIEHGGSNIGVKTHCVMLPKSKLGVLIFTNGDNGLTICNNIIRESLENGQQILDFMYGAVDYPIIKLPDEALENYVGTYLRSDLNGWKIIIKREGGALKLSGDGLPEMEMLPYAEDKFFIKGFGFQYEFIRDETNEIILMNIYEEGKHLLNAKKTTF